MVRDKFRSLIRATTWNNGRHRNRSIVNIATLVIALATAVLVIVFGPEYDEIERRCIDQPFACGMATNLLATATVAFFASVIWIGLASQRRAVDRYLARVRKLPHSLVGRDESTGKSRHDAVVNALLQELYIGKSAETLLVVGASGSGKTETLIELARRLAKIRVIPIFVSLGRLTYSIDLVDEAKNALRKEMDPYLRTEAHFDVIWRKFRRRSRFVILADALDELAPELDSVDRERELIRLLSGVGDGLHVVVSTRPNALPSQLHGPRFFLSSSSHRHNRHSVEANQTSTQSDLIRTGRLEALPYFLVKIDESSSETSPGRGPIETRLNLLRSNVHSRVSDDRLLDSLILLAAAGLTLGRYEFWQHELIERALRIGPFDTEGESLEVSLTKAEQLRIVHIRVTSAGKLVSFEHPLMCAFLASRSDDLKTSLVLFGPHVLPEAVLALQWACVSNLKESEQVAEWMAINLNALSGATGAVELAGEVGFPLPAGVRRAWTERSKAVPVSGKLVFIEALGECLPDQTSIDILWSALGDPAYEVRWAAARGLSRLSEDDYTRIAPRVEDYLNLLDQRDPAAIDPELVQERVCWFLPSLSRSRQELLEPSSPRYHLTRLLSLVNRLVGLSVPGSLGLESSLAQGYKLEAAVFPGGPPDVELLKIASNSRFWYARIEAILAIALKVRNGNTRTKNDASAFLRRVVSFDAHPLVVATAQFAHEAIERNEVDANVWLTEGDLLTSPVAFVSDHATLLLADILLFLNLSANAYQGKRDSNAALEELPRCLDSSKHRSRLFADEGCATDVCQFGLCPYEREVGHIFFRGNFSETFSRNVIHAAYRIGVPRWYRGSRRSYIEPWIKFENRG